MPVQIYVAFSLSLSLYLSGIRRSHTYARTPLIIIHARMRMIPSSDHRLCPRVSLSGDGKKYTLNRDFERRIQEEVERGGEKFERGKVGGAKRFPFPWPRQSEARLPLRFRFISFTIDRAAPPKSVRSGIVLSPRYDFRR